MDLIKRIRDELRRVEDGLWLGQGYLRWRGTDRLMVYFALYR